MWKEWFIRHVCCTLSHAGEPCQMIPPQQGHQLDAPRSKDQQSAQNCEEPLCFKPLEQRFSTPLANVYFQKYLYQS